ncbi:SHOCT domain-containing protein [Actinomadura logoneensis]|uniref:SHOCT domain-containing protein n=2 Tax=Actinomadura logoneensis TaxID=2293572 RepID=A0A372JI18_9ACTN|nr:SHOCT domain-containing protein [Actinomadura logoneensis]
MGHGSGGTWGWMALMMMGLWTLVIGAAVWIVLRAGFGRRRDGGPAAGDSPRDRATDEGGGARAILAERYARGEIDTEEYEERLARLG